MSNKNDEAEISVPGEFEAIRISRDIVQANQIKNIKYKTIVTNTAAIVPPGMSYYLMVKHRLAAKTSR